MYLLKELFKCLNGFALGIAPLAIGAIAGGAAALGNAVGGIFSANKSAEASAANVKKQIAWERERATNAHQWEVEDLKKAGLNPILSAGGSGAVTSGITPQMPDTSGYETAFKALGNMPQDMISNAQDFEQKKENIEVTKATGLLTYCQAIESAANAGLLDAKEAGQMIQNAYDQRYGGWERVANITHKWSGTIKNVATPLAEYFGLRGIAKRMIKRTKSAAKKVGGKLSPKELKKLNKKYRGPELSTGNIKARYNQKGGYWYDPYTGEIME